MTGKKINVGILFGGKSAEHEVSLQSARNVIDAIDKEKYNPILIGIDKSGKWMVHKGADYLLNISDPKLIRLNESGEHVALIPQNRGKLTHLGENTDMPSVDVVFPVLHGPYGEDGALQGLLKMADVPFVGAGVLGSAVGMDKDVMKRLLRDAEVPIAKFITLRVDDDPPDYKSIVNSLGEPFFIKPANLGSSIGISKVSGEKEYESSVKLAFRYDNKVIIEENITGREIECAILGNAEPIVSVPGEIIPRHDFYSYDAKYIDEDGAELVVPAELDEAVIAAISEQAVSAYKTLSCEGMARMDFFLTENNGLYVNEINTIPGFTSISMYPMLWQASGISYVELIDRLIQLAFERYESEKRLNTTYNE